MIPPAAFPPFALSPLLLSHTSPNMGDYTSPYCASEEKKTSPLSLSVANSQRANPPAAAFYARTGGDDAAAASLLSPPLPDTPCDTDPCLSLQSPVLTIRSAAVIYACFNVTNGWRFLGDIDLFKRRGERKRDGDTICRVRMRCGWENVYTPPQPCVKTAL